MILKKTVTEEFEAPEGFVLVPISEINRAKKFLGKARDQLDAQDFNHSRSNINNCGSVMWGFTHVPEDGWRLTDEEKVAK